MWCNLLILSTAILAELPATAAELMLVWSDEFDGVAGTTTDPSKWGNQIGDGSGQGIPGWGNSELQYYTDSTQNVVQDGNGSLVITARSDNAATYQCYYGPCKYTSARLFTGCKFAHQYGRFEARIKIPTGQGLWPAFWMLGDNHQNVGWPQCGEIDIMEVKGSRPHMVSGALHLPGHTGGGAVTTGWYTLPGEESFADNYHTFAIDWEPNTITWYVDDVAYQQKTLRDVEGKQWVFDHPFYILMNLAVGGHYDGDPGINTTFPQSVMVDHVRVYESQNYSQRFNDTIMPNTATSPKVENATHSTTSPPLTTAKLANVSSSTTSFSTRRPSVFVLKLEAESAEEQIGTSTEDTHDGGIGGRIVNHIGNGDMLVYKQVNFGPGINSVHIRYASGVTPGVTGIVRMHLDQPTSQYFALFGIGTTNGWQTWRTIPGTVSPPPSGIHDLYIIFQSDHKDCFASINWFKFTEQTL